MSRPAVEVLFASVDEPNAKANLDRIRQRVPAGSRIVEITNVKGFANVLIAAESSLSAKHFFLVDADAHVLDAFRFVMPEESKHYTCCIYRALNPINDLAYGHGGIKVYDRHAIFSFLHDVEQPGVLSDSLEALNLLDFPCGGSRCFLEQTANIHQFNSSFPMTWRSAFRESAKLRYLTRLQAFGSRRSEIDSWRHGWLSRGATRQYGLAALQGAAAGDHFGGHANSNEILLVNDYNFLAEQFAKHEHMRCLRNERERCSRDS